MAWCVHLQPAMEPQPPAAPVWCRVGGAQALAPPSLLPWSRRDSRRSTGYPTTASVCLVRRLLVRLCRSSSGEALSKLQPALFSSNVHVKALKIGLVQEIDACALRFSHCRFVYLTDAGVFSPSTCTWIPDEHLGWE